MAKETTAAREAKLAGFEGGVREVAKWLGVTDKTIRHRFNNDKELFEASLRNAKEAKNKSNK